MPLALVFGAMAWLAARLAPWARIAIPWAAGLAMILSAAGGVLALGGMAAFRSARTTTNPLRPEAAATIVSSGAYRVSRNPMYLGLLLCLAGWAVYLSHLIALAFPVLFVAYMNRFQILPEERALAEKFGAAYADYKHAVRRWL